MTSDDEKPGVANGDVEKTIASAERTPRRGPASRPDSGETFRFPSKQGASDEAEPVEEFPRFPSARYRLDRLIGEGGMGVVYRAFDTQLNRNVALKFLRGGVAPGDAQRFLREARAQARVRHPNICEVHETGELDAGPYISMQFIDGMTCREAGRKLTVEQKARLCKDVALALQAAHTAGLIHRDIKPGNILVAEAEDGSLQPFITDFGLARDMEEPGLTRMGEALGSPAYMAPEQAEGDSTRMDRRTDVYGLGATLYEMLTLVPPFSGTSSFEVMTKVVNEDPVPVRRLQPGVPADLETIVMKCLEKNPEARYESARALAADLDRFLAGEPLAAQRSSVLDRLRRKAKKHPVTSALLGLAALVAVVSIGTAIGTATRARERERLSQSFGQEVERMVGATRLSSLLPLHDIRPERERVHQRIQEIREQMARLGAAAQGPGLYAVGRGYLALREDVEAEKALRAAWNAGFQEPEAAYALGQVLGYRYQKEKAETRRIPNKEKREARLAEIRREYREPAIEFLLKSERLASASPLYVKGLIAFYEEKYAEAIAHARKALESDPWFFEAHVLEGQAHQAVGFERHVKGDYEGASGEYIEALRSYEAAAGTARSAPLVQQQACGVWIHLFEIAVTGELDPVPPGQDAEECSRQIDDWCGRASQADPDAALPYSIRALKSWKWGKYFEASAGLDPRPSYQRAMDLGHDAIRRDPKLASAHAWIGVAALYWSEYLTERGEDPEGCLWEAQRSLKDSLAADPHYRVAYNASAVLGVDLARLEFDKGRDPSAMVAWAVENARKALDADPSYSHAHDSMADALLVKAHHALLTGRDPRADLELAESALLRSMRINPNSTPATLVEARLHLFKAHLTARSGRDPAPDLEKARQAAARAEAREPGPAASVRGFCALSEAWWLLENGRIALESAAAARREFDAALGAVRNSATDLGGRAEALLLAALSARNPPDRALLRMGESDVREALRLNPRSADLVLLQAVLAHTGVRALNPRESEGAAARARGLAGESLEMNPLVLKKLPHLARLIGR
ncbi:MAG: protein kinase [Acidobacteria bacterium]|nr:protein kinase [Acidobacteriota bacterium]